MENNFSGGKGTGKTRQQLVRVNECLSSILITVTRSLNERWLEQEAASGQWPPGWIAEGKREWRDLERRS